MLNLNLIELESQLKDRYKECDSEGHKAPNKELNRCDYCFRRLSYDAPETAVILKEQSKLPLLHQPMNASALARKREQEIMSQKISDLTNGVKELSKLEGSF